MELFGRNWTDATLDPFKEIPSSDCLRFLRTGMMSDDVARVLKDDAIDAGLIARKFNEIKAEYLPMVEDVKGEEMLASADVWSKVFWAVLTLAAASVAACLYWRPRRGASETSDRTVDACLVNSEKLPSRVNELLNRCLGRRKSKNRKRINVDKGMVEVLFDGLNSVEWNDVVEGLAQASDGELEVVRPETGDAYESVTMYSPDGILTGRKAVLWGQGCRVGLALIRNGERKVFQRAIVDVQTEGNHGN